MNWRVTIDFKRGPAFAVEIEADKRSDAIRAAEQFARGCGFDGPIKKSDATPA